MSWISIDDFVRVVEHVIQREELSGAINTCAPNPVQNAAFVAALGAAMNRPAVVPMPTAVVRTVFGEMGDEMLLVSQRAVPEKLLASGFRFMHPTIEEGITAALRG